MWEHSQGFRPLIIFSFIPPPFLELCLHYHTVYVLLQTVLFRPTPTYVYKASFIGALLSYSVVVFKSLGVPKLDIAWARRAFLDENVQYALLALYWSLTKPVARE